MALQVAELERLFGQIQICQDVNSWKCAEDIAKIFQNGNYNEMMVVLPLSVIAKLTEFGIKPLWADMQQVFDHSEADLTYSDRFYKFMGIRRIKTVRMEFEKIEGGQINAGKM
jgi:hypothetical protein